MKSMPELASFGNKRSYDDFKKQVPQKVQPLFDLIRKYCLSLGENVVEDIRMHRVVFGKSMTFRWFADVAPQESSLVIKIQKDRKETPTTHHLEVDQDLDQIKKFLKESYDTIR
jgi:predicted transport protein